MRLFLVLFLSALSLPAQFNEFSTTGDGSVLYFTSQLTLRGTPAGTSVEPRLYRLDSQGVKLFFERPQTGIASGNGGVYAPQVSSDNRTIAFTLHGACTLLDCRPVRAELRGGYDGLIGEGTVRLSRNGQWAVVVPPATNDIPTPYFAKLIHIPTGSKVETPAPSASGVANDGSIVTLAGLLKDGVTTPIGVFSGNTPSITPDARSILYALPFRSGPGSGDYGATLQMRSVASGEDRVLYRTPNRGVGYRGISDDSRYVLFHTTDQRGQSDSYVVDTETLQVEPLPLPASEFTTAAAISGDGRIVYLGTTVGRIVKFTLTGGRVVLSETAMQAPPFLLISDPSRQGIAWSNFFRRGVVPGSLVYVRVNPDLVSDSNRFLLGGLPLVTFARNGNEHIAQVAWNQPAGREARIEMTQPPHLSPLEDSPWVFVRPSVPAFNWVGGTVFGGFAAVKGDFSGLVTETPKPNDIIHLYATGLGAVARPPATGEPAPLEPNRLLSDTSCRFSPLSAPAETLYAGLAPGMIGIYQLSFRMPNESIEGSLNGISCSFGNDNFSIYWGTLSEFGNGLAAPHSGMEAAQSSMR